MDEVGSAPAESKNKTGLDLDADFSMESIASLTGWIYLALPITFSMNYKEVVTALSSLRERSRESFRKDPISGSLSILSWKSGIGWFSGSAFS